MSWRHRITKTQDHNTSASEAGILNILKKKSKMKQVPGGTPITYDEATDLRRVLQGSLSSTVSGEFKSSGFQFNEEDGHFPYGLQVERNGCRGIIICVQAHLMRHLVFKGNSREEIQQKEELRPGVDLVYQRLKIEGSVLRPGSQFRRDALVGAVCEMIWRAGDEEEKCCVALPQDGDSTATFPQSGEFKLDGITEKLHLYKFYKHDDLHYFVRKNMEFFESESTSGCLLLAYSLALSRGLDNVVKDLGGGRLLSDNEECSQGLINLMLFGRSVLGVSNTDDLYDSEGKKLTVAKYGVRNRGSCGYLYWHKDEEPLARTEVGSMLKTPKYPIWVTNVNNNFAVLFSLNPDLTRDWREEHKFDLYYYTGLSTQLSQAKLTIETRHGRKAPMVVVLPGEEPKLPKVPGLEQCILTKWPGAEIDWNGSMPFV